MGECGYCERNVYHGHALDCIYYEPNDYQCSTCGDVLEDEEGNSYGEHVCTSVPAPDPQAPAGVGAD